MQGCSGRSVWQDVGPPFSLLESEVVSDLLTQVASLLEVEQVPGVEAIRLGCLTALSKPDGGVRGIVV